MTHSTVRLWDNSFGFLAVEDVPDTAIDDNGDQIEIALDSDASPIREAIVNQPSPLPKLHITIAADPGHRRGGIIREISFHAGTLVLLITVHSRTGQQPEPETIYPRRTRRRTTELGHEPMKRTGDPKHDRIEVTISGEHWPGIPVRVSDVDGLTSYYIPLDLGVLGRHDIVLDLFHPDDVTTPEPRRTPLHPTQRELADARHAIAKLVADVAIGREQPSREVLDDIATAALRASGWAPPGWGRHTQPPPNPIPITRDPEPPSLVQRLREWSKGR